jgi:hypothetical protein
VNSTSNKNHSHLEIKKIDGIKNESGQAIKGHHMVNLSANANPFTQGVIVVAWHMRHDRLARFQAQGVKKL